jgi:hypothetical protein
MADLVFSLTSGTSSVTHGETTFIANGSYQTGNYSHGPAYIVVPSGKAPVTRSPGGTTIDGYVVNGMMKNPRTGTGEQGFDAFLGDLPLGFGTLEVDYDPDLNVGNSVLVEAGDILIAPVSLDPRPANYRDGFFDGDVATCYILAEAPAANARPPAALGWEGRGTPTGYVVDVAAKVAALPAYSSAGIPMPTYEQIIARLDYFDPLFAMEPEQTTVYQSFTPNQLLDGSNFGRFYAGIIQGAMLALISDALTAPQKEHVATLLLDRGIQWYDSWANSPASFYAPNGGHMRNSILAAWRWLWSGRGGQSFWLTCWKISAAISEVCST